ncbi:hypothetical protein MICRO8M_130118 [Microbacterium sp. 8M]|nr:hypothetical protein MICRO8M_130118 [Microbacterium sp. 8M]
MRADRLSDDGEIGSGLTLSGSGTAAMGSRPHRRSCRKFRRLDECCGSMLRLRRSRRGSWSCRR